MIQHCSHIIDNSAYIEEPKQLVCSRKWNGKQQYLVRWRGGIPPCDTRMNEAELPGAGASEVPSCNFNSWYGFFIFWSLR